MRTINTDTAPAPSPETTPYKGATYSAALSDGREIVIREMKGSDLIYMEEELEKYGETKKSFYLIERLSVGTRKVTFADIAELGIRDIKVISELISRANGTDEEDPK
jgi:hypothetical protein